MKALLTGIFVLALAIPVPAQRIETQRADRSVVRLVETMANHLTVIELTEPVVMAAAGSPAFKIERQGNKVLIQPIEEDATTNLFIWTASGRFSYELVPAKSIATMDFAIDQQPYPAEKNEPRAGHVESERSGIPIRKINEDAGGKNVSITITDVTQDGGQFLIRYEATTLAPPEVFELKSPRSSASFHDMRYTQVDSKHAAAIRDKGMRRVPMMDYKAPMSRKSDENASGLVTLSFKPNVSEPTVLRLVFQSANTKPTAIVLVL
jgi:hypothetical protein